MIRRPPRSTRAYPLVPYLTLFRARDVLVDVRQVADPDAADLLAPELHVRAVVDRHALAGPSTAVGAPREHQHLAHGLARLVGPAAFAFVVDDDGLFLAAATLHVGHRDGDRAAKQRAEVNTAVLTELMRRS